MKRLWVFVALAALSVGVWGDGARGGPSDDNLFFHVSDDQGGDVVAASVLVCADKTLKDSCMEGQTDGVGNVSFLVQYNGELNNIALFYQVRKQGFVPYQGEARMFISGGAVEINNFGSVNLPDLGYLDIPYSAGATEYVSHLFGGDYNASVEGDLRIRLGGETPLDYPGYKRICEPSLGIPCAGSDITPATVRVSLNSMNLGFLSWTDLFPSCSETQGADILQCASEVVVPNFHLDAIVSLFKKGLLSFLSLPKYLAGGDASQRIMLWAFSFITAFALAFLIFPFSFVEAYLVGSLIYLSWAAAFDVLIHQNIMTRGNYLVFLTGFFIFALAASMWFLGSSLNLWAPLWGGG